MLKRRYNNFVKASALSETVTKPPTLSGEQARQIYLKEVEDANNCTHFVRHTLSKHTIKPKVQNLEDISHKDLFLSVQNNYINMLQNILDSCPSLINMVDDYGWSLLMIACQANSVDVVKELLKRGIDTSVRDKGGNSATTLVIRNKNIELADLLISHRKNNPESISNEEPPRIKIPKVNTMKKEKFACDMCNKVFPDKKEHLASTVHNISASKDKKIPANYTIPQTNRGYQLMLKVGWDRECGLGRDGSGKKYPIKAVLKKDRKGLGHKKIKKEELHDSKKNNKLVVSKSINDKSMEINFRREFY